MLPDKAATVGFRECSKSCSSVARFGSAAIFGVLNSLTSAPGREELGIAHEDHGFDAGVGHGARELIGYTRSVSVRQGVDGWIVELDDGYITVGV